MASVTDLAVVAGRLTRAADRLDKLTARTTDPWFSASALADWGGFPREDAEFVAALPPRTVATLVPLLRQTAKRALRGGDGDLDLIESLHTFATRLLREDNDDA